MARTAVRQAIMAAARYNGTNRYGTEANLRKAYDAYSGSSTDVNLLLIAALRQAGLPAQPVLLSTRAHGRASQTYPLLDKFDYVVALVPDADGHDLLVDATDPDLPCGTLPVHCPAREHAYRPAPALPGAAVARRGPRPAHPHRQPGAVRLGPDQPPRPRRGR